MVDRVEPSARERALRTFFWSGSFFAGWLHLFMDVLWSDGRTTPWFLAEPAWWAVAGVYTVATAAIAVIDVRRVK